MPEARSKMGRAEFNALVGALANRTLTVANAAAQDPQLHLRRGIHDETLLHFFVVEARPDLVRELASLGADLNTENEFGNTPLIEAVIKGDQPMVEVLLELGANPNWQSSRDQNTALHVAADYERRDVVGVLLRAGANTALENKYSETPTALIAKNKLSV